MTRSRPRGVGLHVGDDLLGRRDVRDDAGAALVVGLADVGQRELARVALDEADAEPLLELRELAAHRRLGEPSCSAAPVKLWVSTTFVKTTMSFRSMGGDSRCYLSAMSRLGELVAKVDAFFARVEARHGGDMQCRTGCSDCCRVRVTVTGVEAAAIRAEHRHLARRAPAHARASVPRRQRGAAALSTRRPLPDLRRPPAGVPLPRRADPDREGPLPVIQSCFRNFTAITPDADCVLDQTTLSAMILAVDRDAGGRGSRIDLATLISEHVGGGC